jgi:hypothetical protein
MATGFKRLNQFQDINIHFYKNGINKHDFVGNDKGASGVESTA